MAQNSTFPVYKEGASLLSDMNLKTGWLKISEGVSEVGHDGDGFSFDNEHGKHKVFIHDFQISEALVTNGEFIEFMENGGYQKFQFWLDEGWSWVEENRIDSPE